MRGNFPLITGNTDKIKKIRVPFHPRGFSAVTAYEPDARVLAEAIAAAPDWFVTHDKVHFIQAGRQADFGFRLETPGDLIQAFKDGLIPG